MHRQQHGGRVVTGGPRADPAPPAATLGGVEAVASDHRGQARGSRASVLDAVEAVAWDLDSTLVDLLAIKARGCRAAVAAAVDAGIALPPDAASAMLAHALHRDIDAPDAAAAYLKGALGGVGRALARRARRVFEAAEDADGAAYAGVPETLADLAHRGYPCILVTDAPRRSAHRRLRAAGLADAFDHVLTLEDTPRGKVDAAPFHAAARLLGLPPERCLMVGDHPARDVGSARAAGWRTALATWGLQAHFAHHLRDHRPDVALARITDLTTALAPTSSGAGLKRPPHVAVPMPEAVAAEGDA